MSYANIVDPDQTPRFAVSDQGLQYLSTSYLRVARHPTVCLRPILGLLNIPLFAYVLFKGC